jgi:hypothetical protein
MPFESFQNKIEIKFSSSSRSEGPPPPYDTLRSNVSAVRSSDSGINSGRQTFAIRDRKLANEVRSCTIQSDRLELGDLLKEGNFGAVFKGKLNNHGRKVDVAVKTLKSLSESETAFEEFMREGVLMKGKTSSFSRKLKFTQNNQFLTTPVIVIQTIIFCFLI